MILQLIKKDIQIQKKFLLSVVFLGLISILASILGGTRLVETVYTFSILFITYIFLINGTEIEGKNNTGIIFASLPLRRREIVTAKYITALSFSLYILVIMTVLGFAFTKFWPDITISIGLNDSLIAIMSSWFFLGLALPVNFIFGFKVARVINQLIFFIMIFGPLQREKLMEYPFNWNPSLWMLGICVFLLLSWLFSIWVYQRREF